MSCWAALGLSSTYTGSSAHSSSTAKEHVHKCLRVLLDRLEKLWLLGLEHLHKLLVELRALQNSLA